MTVSWKPNRLWWEAYIVCSAGGFVTLISMWGMVSCIIWIASGVNIDSFWKEVFALLMLTPISAGFAMLVSLGMMFIPDMNHSDMTKSGRWLMRNCNPVGIVCWTFYGIALVLKSIASLYIKLPTSEE